MQWKAFPILAVLVAVALAGCLGGDDEPRDASAEILTADGDPFYDNATYRPNELDLDALSKPIHEILPVEEVWVPTSDATGTRIHNAVFRPDTDEPTPVFINFSPYFGDEAEDGGDAFSTYLIENFVPRGYTVVLSAIRGTGHSEGCFEVSSDRELQDLQEVVDFFAEQPWSNGMVGAGGKSYDSTPQNGMVAKYPTENLKTIFHVSGITDWYEYTFHNGVMARVDAAAFTARYAYGQGLHEYGGAGAGAAGSTDDDDPESLARIAGDAACVEAPENVVVPVATAVVGAKTPYWVERDWTRTIGDTAWEGSIFFYHGLQDWNVQPSHILPWLENVPDTIDTKVWLHQNEENLGHVYPMRTDWNLTMLRYLDQELKGVDTGFWDEPRIQVEGSDDRWRTSPDWPLAGEPTALEVGDGGVLLEATDTAMRYGGAPTITATATPMIPDPVFTAVLYDEGPDGEREWRNEAVLRLVFRDSLETPSPVVVGQPVTFTTQFYPQDDVLEPGHRWVVEFQQAPDKSIPAPGQVEGLTVDASSATVDLVLAEAGEGLSPQQPVPTNCFAC